KLEEARGVNFISFHRIVNDALFRQNFHEYIDGQRTYNKPGAEDQRLILKFRGKAIGTIEVRPFEDMANIRYVAIASELHGQGHGNALIELTAEFARNHGFHSLCVNSDHHHKVTAFYEGCGFKRSVWNQAVLDEWD